MIDNNSGDLPLPTLSNDVVSGDRLVGAANLARAHAGSLSLFGISKEKDPCAIYPCAGPAARSAINFRSFVTQNCSTGDARRVAVHRETVAAKQSEFACGATDVSADSSVRRNHTMARCISLRREAVRVVYIAPYAF